MIIKIKGKPSKIEMKMVKKAMNWYADRLFTSRLDESITINVIFIKNLYRQHKSLGSCGPVEYMPRPKDFDIEVDADLSWRNILKTLAHEMVHVKQYASGQLKEYTRNNNIRWEDMVFENGQSYDEEYWFTPWEIEAYGMEVGLYTLFRKQLRKEARIAAKKAKKK